MKFHKVVIYYFSGTGNAKNTSFWIGDEVKRQGVDIEIINIDKIQHKEISQPAENTLIGFISPTHGFHFPEIMRKFISRFPKVKNCSAFIVNTRAGLRIGKVFLPGLSGVLHYWSSIVLNGKGFKIVGLLPVDLPSNWLSIHPTIRKKGIELIYQHIEPKVKHFATKILDGKTSCRALYDIIQDTLIAPVSILYILFARYFFAKSFIASSDCDMCGLCEKTCPVKAIKQVDSRIFWTYKCESCMKCMNDCPQKAIETAHGFIIVIWFLASLFVGYVISHLLNYQTSENWQWLQNENIKTLIVSFAIFPFLFIGYRLMHWLMRFKLFERIFVLSALTKYNFWGRYKAPNKRIKTHSNNV